MRSKIRCVCPDSRYPSRRGDDFAGGPKFCKTVTIPLAALAGLAGNEPHATRSAAPICFSLAGRVHFAARARIGGAGARLAEISRANRYTQSHGHSDSFVATPRTIAKSATPPRLLPSSGCGTGTASKSRSSPDICRANGKVNSRGDPGANPVCRRGTTSISAQSGQIAAFLSSHFFVLSD